MKLNIFSLARLVFVALFLFSWVSPGETLAFNHPKIALEDAEYEPTVELKTVPADPITPSPHPILSDIRIRRAIAYCTDKDALVAAAYPHLTPAERQDLIMDTFVHHSSWAYSAPAMTYPYSTTLGTALLEGAGWTLPAGGDIRMKGGLELALTLTTSDMNMRLAITPVFEDQMRDCGIRLIRNHQSSPWWFGDWTGLAVRDFELGQYTWVNIYNPGGDELYACDQIPLPTNNWSGKNYPGWCNPTASDAIIQASDTSLPQPVRQAHYATFIDLFADDMPVLPLFAREGSNYNSWEHIDFNLETFSQGAAVTYDDGGTLNFTSFHNYDGFLFVPAGVVTSTTGIMYTPLEGALGGALDGMEHLINFRLTALQNGVPLEELTFTEPVTLTHHYADPINIYEGTLQFYYWDGSNWLPAVETCPEGQRHLDLDTENNTLVSRICHFSEFSMMGEKKYNIYQPMVVRG